MGAMEKTMRRAESPFLAKAAQLRTGANEIPGYYSDELDMWVVETENGSAPIISQGVLAQLLTKTRADGEVDDDSPFALQLMTKTEQQLEGDDDRPFASNHMLQLLTKTHATQEADDNFEAGHLLELITKTAIQQESDDDEYPFANMGAEAFQNQSYQG